MQFQLLKWVGISICCRDIKAENIRTFNQKIEGFCGLYPFKSPFHLVFNLNYSCWDKAGITYSLI